MHAALLELGLEPSVAYDRAATQRLLRGLLGPLAHDEALTFDLGAEITVRDALKNAWKARKVAKSGELLFLLRTLLGLSSVLARLGSRANWRRRLEDVIAKAPAAARSSARGGATGVAHPHWRREAAAAERLPRIERKTRDTSWDVVLVAAGNSPIALIRALRELRELRGKDLRDLESLVDSVPETLTHAVPRADAREFAQASRGGWRARRGASSPRADVIASPVGECTRPPRRGRTGRDLGIGGRARSATACPAR